MTLRDEELKPPFLELLTGLLRSVLSTAVVVLPLSFFGVIAYSQYFELERSRAVSSQMEMNARLRIAAGAYRGYIEDIGVDLGAARLSNLGVIRMIKESFQPTAGFGTPDLLDIKGGPQGILKSTEETGSHIDDALASVDAARDVGFSGTKLGSSHLGIFTEAYAKEAPSAKAIDVTPLIFKFGVFIFLLLVITCVLFVFVFNYFRTTNSETRRAAEKTINTIVGFLIGLATGIAGGAIS